MTPILPFWLAAGVATVVLLILTAHLIALNRADMDPRRKRLRISTNFLMMVIVPLLAYGFGVARTSEPRMFVLVWTIIPALLFMVILLALADAAHTAVLHRRTRRDARLRLRADHQKAEHTG